MFQCQLCTFAPCSCGEEAYDLRNILISLTEAELYTIIVSMKLDGGSDSALLRRLENTQQNWKVVVQGK